MRFMDLNAFLIFAAAKCVDQRKLESTSRHKKDRGRAVDNTILDLADRNGIIRLIVADCRPQGLEPVGNDVPVSRVWKHEFRDAIPFRSSGS